MTSEILKMAFYLLGLKSMLSNELVDFRNARSWMPLGIVGISLLLSGCLLSPLGFGDEEGIIVPLWYVATLIGGGTIAVSVAMGMSSSILHACPADLVSDPDLPGTTWKTATGAVGLAAAGNGREVTLIFPSGARAVYPRAELMRHADAPASSPASNAFKG